MGWCISRTCLRRRIKHPKEVLKKGDKIEVLVLNIDKNARRISLGLKQVLDDPWPSIVETLRVGTRMIGKVDRVVERGVYLRLGEELEGFLPFRESVTEASKTVGADVPVKIVNINPQIRQIVVSEKSALAEDARAQAANAEEPGAGEEKGKVANAPETVTEESGQGQVSSDAPEGQGGS